MSVREYEETFRSSYDDSPAFDDDESHQWMNRCTLECKECVDLKKFRTRNKLVHHLYKDHNMLIKDYLDKHSTLYVLFEFYTCKICDRSIRWDSDNIIAHLDKSHQVCSVFDYHCVCRDHCILGQAFITFSPISDAFDNIDNFFYFKQMI